MPVSSGLSGRPWLSSCDQRCQVYPRDQGLLFIRVLPRALKKVATVTFG